MLTGFNTDVAHDGITYHVQTEDKGLDAPIILSLVYVGGAILASKRTPYDDLIAAGLDEQALAERIHRQHKLICAAIRAGRIEDLKRMGARDTAPAPAKGQEAANEKQAQPPETLAPPDAPAAQPARQETPPPVQKTPAPIKAPMPEASPGQDAIKEIPIAPPTARAPTVMADSKPQTVPPRKEKGVSPPPQTKPAASRKPAIIQTPPAASAPPAPSAPTVRAVASSIADFARPAAAADDLHLVLLDDEGDFRAGELVTIRAYVGRGAQGREAIPNAPVSIKVLGTAFRPQIFSLVTDEQGIALVRTQLPTFTAGRAAIMIRATAGGYEAELRRIIQPAKG